MVDGTSDEPPEDRPRAVSVRRSNRSFGLCPHPYTVPAEKLEDTEFIRALTIKELPGKLSTGPVLTLDGQAFNALQLRAIVKDVTLHDSYARLGSLSPGERRMSSRAWCSSTLRGSPRTSGLKDEVLRHCLEQKSNRIAIELWKEDELDIIVHLVLCGRTVELRDPVEGNRRGMRDRTRSATSRRG